jgi:hypothetical protein
VVTVCGQGSGRVSVAGLACYRPGARSRLFYRLRVHRSRKGERARHDPAQFFDVGYAEFVADPVGTVEAVYAHFGLALTGPARAAMLALRAHSAPARVGPAHRYALSDFGLTDGEVDERFGSR